MNKIQFAIALCWLLVLPLSALVAQKPNVIFILTDDQGYGDLACHGNPWIKTPNLDKLHAESVRFTNFHVGTTCAPSRSGLMTGKYCNKVGVWHTVNGREILREGETTLAEKMKTAGYKTGIFGKWHLGDNYPFRPQDRGFDEVLIHGGGGVGQQPDYWENDYFDDTYFHNGKPQKYKGYCTDVWFSEALKFIKANKNKPFFCYLPTNAPHGPYNIADKYSNPYKNNPNIPNPNFYGMITNIDENIGRLREELKKMGIDKNTILVFMTDNGTAAGVKFGKNGEVVSGYNADMRGIKGSPYDGGHRVPFFINWPDGKISSGKDITNLTAYIDVMPTLLDLCGINAEVKMDGTSLKPLINDSARNWLGRTLFTDTQREEQLIKWKQPAIMTDDWRLVGKDELYDMTRDASQKTDVAAQNPGVVQTLKAAYETWWADVSQNADEYASVKIGTKFENPVCLNSHDLHVEKGLPTFSQYLVREAKGENGFWAVDITRTGTYEIELCRWPKESKLKMTDAAPKGQPVEGGNAYAVGKALAIKKGSIKLGKIALEKALAKDGRSIKFKVNIDAGKTNLHTSLFDDNGTERPAYYVYFKFIK